MKLTEEILKDYREKFCAYVDENGNKVYPPHQKERESFLLSSLERVEKKVVEDICVMIDIIESQSKTNTLEEWKQYKHIRNAIRSRYVLTQNTKPLQGDEENPTLKETDL